MIKLFIAISLFFSSTLSAYPLAYSPACVSYLESKALKSEIIEKALVTVVTNTQIGFIFSNNRMEIATAQDDFLEESEFKRLLSLARQDEKNGFIPIGILYTVKGHPVVAMATTTETGEGYDCVIDFLKFPVFF